MEITWKSLSLKLVKKVLYVMGENQAEVTILYIKKGRYYYNFTGNTKTWNCPIEEFDYESKFLTPLEELL